MKFKSILVALLALALSCAQALAQATILPPGETCFQATTGINGMVGVLGTITGGNSYTSGTYGGVPLTGGSGTGATANITVSGGTVTQVTVLNPGIQYVVGDVLSALAVNIGGSGTGFTVPVASTSINSSLAGGTVGFYIPNTQTFKQTWQDAGQTILNQNPVPLDQNGCATIYGAGIYRQILQDNLGNTVWDKVTASTSPVGIFWAGPAAGTGNAITITDSSFALQDGATIQFLAFAPNTGPTTISISGGSPIAIVNDTSSGPAALSGGEIGIGNTPLITYDATNVEFHLVNPAATTSSSGGSASLAPPQGYLNLVGQSSGDVIQSGDIAGTSTIFYSPFIGNTIPIWNGSTFKQTAFNELTATLTATGSASLALQDACVFSNNGTPALAIGPAWTTPTAGSSNRGTGAGTAQITRLQGIWVNANTITAYNGIASFTIAANQCTYVGSLYIDVAAGQVSAYRSFGQNRKWGVWNAYNRQPILMQAGDATASWSYTTNAYRPSNGNPSNAIATFTGLPEEPLTLTNNATTSATLALNQTSNAAVGFGFNSNTLVSGKLGEVLFTNSAGTSIVALNNIQATYLVAPTLGLNVVTSLENGLGSNAVTWNGTSQNMLLSASYRG